jgi:ElaB/YqjD/DUF883 family membrane-anchored ribosome-binding protein
MTDRKTDEAETSVEMNNTEEQPEESVEFDALDEEEKVVAEASMRPAVGGAPAEADSGEGDEATGLVWMLAVLVIALIAWFGGAAIYQIRQDIQRLDSRVDSVVEAVDASEQRRTRAALERARADLESARDGVDEAQQQKLEQAAAILKEISDGLEPSR